MDTIQIVTINEKPEKESEAADLAHFEQDVFLGKMILFVISNSRSVE